MGEETSEEHKPVFFFYDDEGFVNISYDFTIASNSEDGGCMLTTTTLNFVDDAKVTPSQLASQKWSMAWDAFLPEEFAARETLDEHGVETRKWEKVTDLRITVVHGLSDAEPSMALALRRLDKR